VLICSAGDDGWPHPAMLSLYDLVALDASRLRLATYASSRTTHNLSTNGTITLMIVDEGAAYYVKGAASRASDAAVPGRVVFDVHVAQVRADRAEAAEGAVRIATGIRYAADDVYWEQAAATLRALIADSR
jgi:hypothetical protein